MSVSKESEAKITIAEDQALREVEGYVEKIERQTEAKKPNNPLKPVVQGIAPVQVSDDQGNIVMQAAQKKGGKIKIVLPMDEEEINKGLHHKIWEAIRWLSEWCIYMIKKYPGRVFYPNLKSRIYDK